MHSSRDCNPYRFPDLRALYRRPYAPTSQADPLLPEYLPRTRCVSGWAYDSCPVRSKRIPTAYRRRRNKKYGSIAPVFPEQIQAAAGIFRKTFLPQPCLSLVSRYDQSNAFSLCDSQLLGGAIQSLVMEDLFAKDLEALRARSLDRHLREITVAQGPEVEIGDRRLVNFSSNDYLG